MDYIGRYHISTFAMRSQLVIIVYGDNLILAVTTSLSTIFVAIGRLASQNGPLTGLG